jgi:hypothetical protein
LEARYFLSTDIWAAAAGLVCTPLGSFKQSARGRSRSFWIGGQPFSVGDDFAAVIILVTLVDCLVGDVLTLPVVNSMLPIGSEPGDCIHFSLVDRQAQFADRKYLPFNFLARINTVALKNAIGEDKGRCSHPRNANPFAAQIFDGVNIAVSGGLNSRAPGVDATRELEGARDFSRERCCRLIRLRKPPKLRKVTKFSTTSSSSSTRMPQSLSMNATRRIRPSESIWSGSSGSVTGGKGARLSLM